MSSSEHTPPDVDSLLERLRGGDDSAYDALLPLVYAELRDLARGYMRGERDGHTLQPTALTHEAFLRLVRGASVDFADRGHFLAAAARAMRQVLVDHARSRGRLKRGGGRHRVTLDDGMLAVPGSSLDVIALDEALNRLAEHDERKARIVELLYFGGLSASEAASVIGVSDRTVERDWQYARAWLLRELGDEGGDRGGDGVEGEP